MILMEADENEKYQGIANKTQNYLALSLAMSGSKLANVLTILGWFFFFLNICVCFYGEFSFLHISVCFYGELTKIISEISRISILS